MGDRLKFLERESVITNSTTLQDSRFPPAMTAATHPSSSNMNQHLEMLLAKINGDDSKITSRIPTRIDPSVVFSDDDEDEETSNPEPNQPKEDIVHNFARNFNISKPTPVCLPKTYSFSQRRSMLSPKFDPKMMWSLDKSKCPRAASKMPCPDLDLEKTPKLKLDFQKPSQIATKSVPARNHKYGWERNEVRPLKFDAPLQTTKSVPNDKASSSVLDQLIQVNKKSYTVLDVLGSGGSCKVYSVLDMEKKTLVAIKVVNLQNVEQSVKEGYKKEIEYLKKLQESNRVIKMYDYEYQQNKLLLVLERGEIDLAKFISNEAKLKQLSPIMVKFYWSQMLEAVADIHNYGIIHSDLKPANFLLVSGHLKLIDFGIATSVASDMTSTFRDSQVGTLNYMSPEAISSHSQTDNKQALFKVGVKSDVWSLGCMLYNLVYGTTPFNGIKTMHQKIIAIVNPKHEIEFPTISDEALLDVMKSCLRRNPKERASVKELLNHPYLSVAKADTPAKPSTIPRTDLRNVMEQMESLTPKRINHLSHFLKSLSKKPDEHT